MPQEVSTAMATKLCLHLDHRLKGSPHSVSMAHCSSGAKFSIVSGKLRPITGSIPGVHAVMIYAGDYVEYGHKGRLDGSTKVYHYLGEFEAVSPSIG